jgi:hypothetical protein
MILNTQAYADTVVLARQGAPITRAATPSEAEVQLGAFDTR